mgnify:CR=1 FL=1
MIKCIGSNLALAIVVDSGHYMRLFRKKKNTNQVKSSFISLFQTFGFFVFIVLNFSGKKTIYVKPLHCRDILSYNFHVFFQGPYEKKIHPPTDKMTVFKGPYHQRINFFVQHFHHLPPFSL